MEKIRVRDAAPTLNMSLSGFYRAVKRHQAELAGHTGKDAGGMFISPKGMEILIDLIQPQVNQGQPESTKVIDQVNQSQSQVNQAMEKTMTVLESRIEEQARIIDRLMTDQSEKDRRHDTVVMTLSQQIRDQGKLIEDMRQAKPQPTKSTPAKVTPIRQAEEKKEHPAKNWGPLKKAVVIMFAPHLLRGSGIRAA